jgi:two-component system, NtrC family, response regulator HydG
MKTATRLLVVEDDCDMCANLEDIFTDLGYQVDVASDGFSALEMVRMTAYDLALLDLKMPGMDGLELYRKIREISAGTVAIVVTAYASSETATSILGGGAWQLVSKPVDFSKLLPLVREALGQPLVLIVDDDKDLCQSLWNIFRERGYRVCFAYDGDEADLRLRARNYNAVIVDMKLPKRPGEAVVKLVRQHNPSARTLVITGCRSEMADCIAQVLSEGAEAVCYKPFDVDELLQTVKRLVAS